MFEVTKQFRFEAAHTLRRTIEAEASLRIRYCLEHPRWRLSLQTHKFIGIP